MPSVICNVRITASKLGETMLKLEQKLLKITLALFLLFFIFFIFFNLNWGAPFYFHPDERNIAGSVSQLNLTSNLNPHFFAYGSFPIYAVYLLGVFSNFISNPLGQPDFKVAFEEAILIGRLFSAVFTLLTILLIYRISYILRGKTAAVLSLVFSATSVGFLQFSHFGTFEMWTSSFSLILFLVFYFFLKTKKEKYFMLGVITLGFLISLKASNIVLISVPLYIIFVELFAKKFSFRNLKTFLRLPLILLSFSILSFVIFAPFNLLDYKSFLGSIKYETNVATGALLVFYTSSFSNSVPVIFQYTRVLPFLINPLLTIIAIPALIYALLKAIRKKDIYLGLCLVFFFSLFLPSSFLFAKWTRYIVPGIPFLYIIIAISLVEIKSKVPQKLWFALTSIILVLSTISSVAFVKTVRLSPDARFEAVKFATNNIPRESMVLSEVYDLGIVPFNNYFPNIKLFNFYELDDNPSKASELGEILKETDYLIIPSQRILKSRITNENVFPEGYGFYSRLISQDLGFEKIYQTPCDIFCKIVYLGNPIFNVEETVNVFDRPTVLIFKNTNISE